MIHAASLRTRLTAAMLLYLIAVTLAVAAHGYIVNERAEHLVWESLLESELAHFTTRQAAEPSYRWSDTDTIKLYGRLSGTPVPAGFAGLSPGVHDEVLASGGQYVALVTGEGRGSTVLALEISDIERRERNLTSTVTGSVIAAVVLLGLLAYAGVGWLMRPLTSMASTIASFSPDAAGQRLAIDRGTPREARVIADSLNGYLEKLDEFVERERAFVKMASHELRTPIAVMSGSAEVALDLDSTDAAVVPYLEHILRTARDMERLVMLLVVLAKDPARLRDTEEIVDVGRLIPAIVSDHGYLAGRKELTFKLNTAAPCTIRAPEQLVRAAVGNLVRNAIENSDRGVIEIATAPDGKVSIVDPGHGMSAEEMTALYTSMARSGERGSAGIGIELISRICEHLGWRLGFASAPRRGTTATLDFRPA